MLVESILRLSSISQLCVYCMFICCGLYLVKYINRSVYDLLGYALMAHGFHFLGASLAIHNNCQPRFLQLFNALYYVLACFVWFWVCLLLKKAIKTIRAQKSDNQTFVTGMPKMENSNNEHHYLTREYNPPDRTHW